MVDPKVLYILFITTLRMVGDFSLYTYLYYNDDGNFLLYALCTLYVPFNTSIQTPPINFVQFVHASRL